MTSSTSRALVKGAILVLHLVSTIMAGPFTMRSGGKLFQSPVPLLKDISVQSVALGTTFAVSDLIEKSSEGKLLLVFLTHLGDLSSWELTQKIQYYLPQLQQANVSLITIAPNTRRSAQLFSSMTTFPTEYLYTDVNARCYSALSLGRGAFPEAPISPYLKLLPMLLGISSKGTLPEVIRGYLGDKDASNAWIKASLKNLNVERQSRVDSEGEGVNYQKPFELASLRLQNMMDVVNHWYDLIPSDEALITQQGGMYAFNKNEVCYAFKDTGILAYGNLEKAMTNLGV